mmetsp:Transcript_32210/g.86272  ORF Transcript_32210/g.86272 Transcript_32210/m.86272 type:complete len:449 (-) Transcript_32210:731-2077(-)
MEVLPLLEDPDKPMIITFLGCSVTLGGSSILAAILAASSADGVTCRAHSCCIKRGNASFGLVGDTCTVASSLCTTVGAPRTRRRRNNWRPSSRRLGSGLGTTTQTLKGPLALRTEVVVLRIPPSVVHLTTRQSEPCNFRVSSLGASAVLPHTIVRGVGLARRSGGCAAHATEANSPPIFFSRSTYALSESSEVSCRRSSKAPASGLSCRIPARPTHEPERAPATAATVSVSPPALTHTSTVSQNLFGDRRNAKMPQAAVCDACMVTPSVTSVAPRVLPLTATSFFDLSPGISECNTTSAVSSSAAFSIARTVETINFDWASTAARTLILSASTSRTRLPSEPTWARVLVAAAIAATMAAAPSLHATPWCVTWLLAWARTVTTELVVTELGSPAAAKKRPRGPTRMQEPLLVLVSEPLPAWSQSSPFCWLEFRAARLVEPCPTMPDFCS